MSTPFSPCRFSLALIACGLLGCTAIVHAEDAPAAKRGVDATQPQFAGPTSDGYLLPNGWRLTPAGEQVALTDLPLNILVSPDSKYAFAATSGYNAHELTVIDLATKKKVAMQSPKQSWFGLAATPGRNRIWWSGGGDAVVHSYEWLDGKLESREDYPLVDKAGIGNETSALEGFRTGVCFDPKSDALYSLTILAKGGNKSFAWGDPTSDMTLGGAITRIGGKEDKPDMSVRCGKRPYDVVLARNGQALCQRLG